jgi:alanine racemase
MDRPNETKANEFAAMRLCVRLPAVVENYRTAKRMAGPAAVAGVVKADAYGLGMRPVARALASAGCDSFFVARLEEGIALRLVSPEARIFVLDGAPAETVPALIANQLTPVLNSLPEIAGWSAAARTMRTELDAAVHIDTGMNRLGLPSGELALLSAEHKHRLAGVRVVLWMSHLACSDDPASKMNRRQLDRFRTALAMLPPAPAALSASGGLMLGKDYHFDLVRPGIALYGGHPLNVGPNPFKTAVVCTARIMQTRTIAAGETVGYGATFTAGRTTKIATAGLGYADGLFRSVSNAGCGAVGGTRIPVAGRVSMDLASFDVTDLTPPPATGMEIELFGDTIALEEIAKAAGTIGYEILTSLSRRAKRTYEENP